MEKSLSPVKIHSLKRKRAIASPLNSIGVLTRSKSGIYSHRNHFRTTRSDSITGRSIFSPAETESAESVLQANSSIKDLRTRRVFTPDVNSIPEKEEGENEGKKVMQGSETGPDSNNVTESEVGDVKMEELEKSTTDQLEAHEEQDNVKNGPNLNGGAGNYSVSESKMALNRCRRGKVFRTSTSFSYRRLLPYLKDMIEEDSPGSDIEIIETGNPSKLQKLDAVKHEVYSNAESSMHTHTVSFQHSVFQSNSANSSANGEEVQNFPTEVPLNQQSLNGSENVLGQNEQFTRSVELEQKGKGNGENRGDALIEEECYPMTPPDPDIITETKSVIGGNSAETSSNQGENQIFKGLPSVSENISNVSLRPGPGSNNNSLNEKGLYPCSRLKLFKNPRSLSYRRLLPFLMDMTKNNTCTSRITQDPMPQMDQKENVHPVSSGNVEQNGENDIRKGNSSKKYRDEHHTQDLPDPARSVLPLDEAPPVSRSNLIPSVPELSLDTFSSNLEKTSMLSGEPIDSCGLNDIQTEGMTQPQLKSIKLEPRLSWEWSGSDSQSSTAIMIHDPSLMQSNREEAEPDVKNLCLNVGLEQQQNKQAPTMDINLYQSSSQFGASDPLGAPKCGPSKGILKRNRQGCRGPCNCLNCALFRLHADRAFEFSRNQMHDAGEIASDLMKELSDLRLLLEKSITNDASHQLAPDEVKQACNRALETEDLAKQRLGQLNHDLDAHCRVPAGGQRKVTFANYIRERVIPLPFPSVNGTASALCENASDSFI